MEQDYLLKARIGFVVLVVVCLVLLFAGTRITLFRMGLSSKQVHKRLFSFSAIILGWIVLTSLLAYKGILSDFSTFPPKFMFLFPIMLISVLTLTFNRRFRAFLAHVPHMWLIGLQVFRLPVELFLWWLFLSGSLPVQMTFEGRNFDILVGVTAPIFAWLCFGKGRNRTKLATFWNIAGLFLLANIVLTAIFSLPTPFRYFQNGPDSSIVATFPVILLPVFLVPLAYSLHFFSLRKIWLEKE